MIGSLLLTLMAGLVGALSALLDAIPLPAWFSDDTISDLFQWLVDALQDSGVTYYLDFSFVFGIPIAWFGLQIALIPARWLLGAARRFLGAALPMVTTDSPPTAAESLSTYRPPRAVSSESVGVE